MQQIFKFLSLIVISVQLIACNTQTREEVVMPLTTGSWRGTLFVQDQTFPFIFRVTYEGKKPVIHLINNTEQIRLDSIQIYGDSLYIPIHLHGTEMRAIFKDSTMTGVWSKTSESYQIPFEARLGKKERFEPADKADKAITDFSGKWEFFLLHKKKDTTHAVGLFEQQGHDLSGTLITKTGNYGNLAGIVAEDSLKLSSFDGDNAYLLTGKYENDTLTGNLWSGKKEHSKFYALKNENAQLTDSVKAPTDVSN